MTDAALAGDTGNPPADTGADALPAGNVSGVDTSAQGGAQQVPDGDLLSGDEGSGSEGVPESYTFEPPEGTSVEITEEVQAALDQFGETAKEMGLSQSQYQSLIEYDLQRATAAEEAAVGEWVQRVEGWKRATMADQEIGGAKYPETKAQAQSALKRFGDPELATLLRNPDEKNPGGLALGNHPAVVRLLAKVGRALGDPTPVDGKETGGHDESGRLRRLYPSMFDD